MELDRNACYRVLLARDARHDGRFFTCVKTTGIYCRPVCPARPPKLVHCVFVPSAAAAHEAGYRPCLRCRPERSPDIVTGRGTQATVSRALSLIERGALDDACVQEFADRLGVSDRQLRRLFHQHVGASPLAVAQTRRVLLAKQLIHDSDLGMTQVALASGFSSVRRFNELFKALYGRPPSALRQRALARSRATPLELLLPYRTPYDFARLLAFLGARAIPGVEHVTDSVYARVIDLDGAVGALFVSDSPERSALRVRVQLPRLSALPALIARVRHLFDLGSDPQPIARELGRDRMLGPLLAARPGLRVPGAWDGFEVAVRAMLGQQVSVRAATRLAGELVARIGKPVEVELSEPYLTHAFPGPERFDRAQLDKLGMPRARSAALHALATAALSDPRLFDAGRELGQAVGRLTELPGIGPWTAQYIAMRALAESDAFPEGDVALMRAAALGGVRPTARALLTRAEAWRPWRAYAAVHLWTHDAEQQKSAAPFMAAKTKEQGHAVAS